MRQRKVIAILIPLFSKYKNHSLFIVVFRETTVNEFNLAETLDNDFVSASGLDVADMEDPKLEEPSLISRITPYAVFCSEEVLDDLHRMTCENVVKTLQDKLMFQM